jgi:hypothetical protein
MKTLRSLFGVLFGFCLLAGIAAGAFILLRRGVELFQSLAIQLAMPLGVASLVVLSSALATCAVARWITKRDQALQLRAERATLYQEVIEYWRRAFQTDNEFPSCAGDEPSADLSRLESKLILHGSAAVISAYLRLRTFSGESGVRTGETGSAYARMIGAMRVDLGMNPPEIEGTEGLPWLGEPPHHRSGHLTHTESATPVD